MPPTTTKKKTRKAPARAKSAGRPAAKKTSKKKSADRPPRRGSAAVAETPDYKAVRYEGPKARSKAPKQIAISQIVDVAPNNGNRTQDDRELQELAASLKKDGLRQPIELWEKPLGSGDVAGLTDPTYAIAFGRRRLAAAVLLGWTEIAAFVIPAKEYDLEKLKIGRALENLRRKELSPIEEALELADLVDAESPGDLDDATIGQALDGIASKIGGSRQYLEDRLRLARLAPECRARVEDGRLPLGHAILIARLADGKDQVELAKWASLGTEWSGVNGKEIPSGRPGLSIPALRSRISERMSKLDRVPWELDKRFAGKRACIGCPQNSANQDALFAAAGDAPASSACLLPGCFAVKKRASDAAQDKAVRELVKLGVSAASKVEKVVPSGLKPGPVARRAKAELDEKASKKSSTSKGSKSSKGRTRETVKPTPQTPDQKLASALQVYRRKAEKALQRLVSTGDRDPVLAVALMLLSEVPGANEYGSGPSFERDRAKVVEAIEKAKTSLDLVERLADLTPSREIQFSTWVLDAEVVAAFELWVGDPWTKAVGELPVLADFEKPEATPAKASTSKKRGGRS